MYRALSPFPPSVREKEQSGTRVCHPHLMSVPVPGAHRFYCASQLLFFAFFKKRLICLKGRHHLLVCSSHGFSSQGWARLKQEPRTWPIFCCLFRHFSRKLDQRWRSWNSSWCSYGVLVLQVVALNTMPQCWPLGLFFNRKRGLWRLTPSLLGRIK